MADRFSAADPGLTTIAQHEIDELWSEGLRQGKRLGLKVASASMAPLICTGDRIIVERFPPGRAPRIGEIILFRTDSGWLVHRIIGKAPRGGPGYLQKGDAGHHAQVIPGSLIAGRVVRIEKGAAAIDLGSSRQRAIAAVQGRLFFLIDRLLRLGAAVGGDGSGRARRWRAPAAGAIRLAERAVARAGAFLARSR